MKPAARRPALALTAACCMALLAGCAVGPDYRRPDLQIPSAYKESAGWKPAQPGDTLPKGKWWEAFGDPVLNGLVEQVDVSSQTLRAAEAAYRQARAQAQVARSALFPLASASAVTTRGKGAGGTPSTRHEVALDAGWEADLWGRIRRSVESGQASAEASAADLAAVRLSLQAELAQSYFLLRVTDEQRRLYTETVAAYQRSLQLANNRYAVGVAPRSDVVQAQAQLKSAQAQAVDLDLQRAQLEHAIALLLGKAPADFSLAALPTFKLALPAIPTGVPSQLLERRPDIAAAERRVAAANAQIGVARAAYFPSLVLSGSAGFQASRLADLFSAPARFWSLGPDIALTLFDGGLRRARSEAAVAAYDQSVANYRQTVLAGLQETEDNLAALHYLEEEATIQQDAVEAARESVRLTLNQYQAGTVSYLNVITVEATALANERTALSILGRRQIAAVQLIRALGGGWDARMLEREAQK